MKAPLPPPIKPTLRSLLLITELHFLPASRFHGHFHGVEDALVFDAILEGWLDWFVVNAGINKIRNGVYESVLVTKRMAGPPPLSDVRVRAGLQHENVPEALAVREICRLIKLKPVQIFQVKAQGALGTIKLEAHLISAARGVPCRLDIGQCPILEPTNH